MPDDLTPMQRSVLLILMAEARELPNTELTTGWKVKLEKPRRDELVKHGLITVRRGKSQRVFLDLTDAGARWCREQRGTDLPARMGHGGAAAYALLSAIQRFLDRTGTSLPEFVARVDRPEPPAAFELAAADLETRIRKAYQELARSGEWVKLADLRPALGGSPRAEVDHTLVLMNRTADVTIVPESDQKTLTERDRAAAVVIGNEDKHLISIGPS